MLLFSSDMSEHFFVFLKHIYIKDICNTYVIYLERYIKCLLKHDRKLYNIAERG